MEKILYDINHAEIAMMRTKSKEVHSSLVFTGVNHLIIKQDQGKETQTEHSIRLNKSETI